MNFIKLISGVVLLRSIGVCGQKAMSSSVKPCTNIKLKYLTQSEAVSLDQDLFKEYKFSVDQLMELAGLSVATAVAEVYPPTTHQSALVICGPGNNGGDGLVAARHMVLFGYNVSIFYPKRTPQPLYESLFQQCKSFGVNVLDVLPSQENIDASYQVMVDALFGFSFKPPVREEMEPALDALINATIPVCSVDVPSGWHVEIGPSELKRYLQPKLLVSLSAPKLCSREFYLKETQHYLGGRFLPPGIIEKYNLTLPEYPGQSQVVKLRC